MNDTELDRLLNTWEAAAPRHSLRDGLRERFPRRERLGFVRPLRWAAAIMVVFAAFAIVTMAVGEAAQNSDVYADSPILRALAYLYENFSQGREARRVETVIAKIKESDPRVFVDGRLLGPPEFGPAKTMTVLLPDEGLYSISLYRYTNLRNAVGRPTGWIEAGHVYGNLIEFQVGSKQVRIECNQQMADRDGPVFIMRRQ
jgi:hypothetical protein